jgi:hypothetical protein
VADLPIEHQVLLLLATLSSRDLVAVACVEKLNIPPEAVDATIAAARVKLTLAADFHRDEELGRAVTRLHTLYERSLTIQDTKTALATVKELNKLLDLYRAAPAGSIDTSADQAAAELAEVRAHLEPLDLGGPDVPTSELARRAVAAFTAADSAIA